MPGHYGLLDPTQAAQFGPQQGLQRPGFVDRILGVTRALSAEDRGRLRGQGLINVGAGLLANPGPFAQSLGQSLLAARGATQQQLAQMTPAFAVSQGDDLTDIAESLIRSGRPDLIELGNTVAQAAERLRPDPEGLETLTFRNQGDDIVGIDKMTGMEVSRIPGGAGARLDGETFRSVQSLASQYATGSRSAQAVAEGYRKIIAADPTAAGDVSMIFGYMKMLDPTSVVREGEQATAANATSVPGQIRNLYNRVITGERLNDDQRADFLRQADNIARATRSGLDLLRSHFSERAERFGLPFEPLDYFEGIDRLQGEPEQSLMDRLNAELGK